MLNKEKNNRRDPLRSAEPRRVNGVTMLNKGKITAEIRGEPQSFAE
jgi:hypothetical protein